MVLNDKTKSGDLIGSTLLITENNKFIYNQRSERLVCKSDLLESTYTWHFLNSSKFRKRVFSVSQGGTQIYVNFPAVKKLIIPIPSLPEQTKIANFLTAVDEKLAQLTSKHDLLTQYKKGVMQQIFSQELRFKDDDGREFAEWEEREIKDIAEVNPKSESLPDEFIYIDLESVEKGILLKESVVIKDDAPSRAQRLLQMNDVLFQMVRPYQGNNLLFCKSGSYVASTGYAQLRTSESPVFLYYLLHLESFTAEVMNRCTGTSYPAINSSDLASMPILVPCRAEQTKIAKFLTAIDDKITATQTQHAAVKQYKQGLLQQMFV